MKQEIENWFAVYTKPRFEKKVIERLKENGYNYYCPLRKVVKQWHDRKKEVIEPIFPSYIFIKISKEKMWKVKEIYGILNYVYWLGRPAIIPESDIQRIKSFLEEHKEAFINNKLKVNDRVKINSGFLMDKEAVILGLRGKLVELEIPSLSVTLSAFVKSSNLTILQPIQSRVG